MSTVEKFEAAVGRSKSLPRKPSNPDLVLLYSLYKQATAGDNENDAPGAFDFVAMAKHKGWLEQKGKSKEDAMVEYIAKIEALEAQG